MSHLCIWMQHPKCVSHFVGSPRGCYIFCPHLDAFSLPKFPQMHSHADHFKPQKLTLANFVCWNGLNTPHGVQKNELYCLTKQVLMDYCGGPFFNRGEWEENSLELKINKVRVSHNWDKFIIIRQKVESMRKEWKMKKKGWNYQLNKVTIMR